MKLLVFAHVPPPHHGQSYMVQMLIRAIGGDCPRRPPGATRADSEGQPTRGEEAIECYHVDCRLSQAADEVGTVRWTKLFLLIKFCLLAIWYRFRFGVKNFLYVPAPGTRAVVYRDWIIMALCRPFFPHRILYWQAAGLTEWIEQQARPWEQYISRCLFRAPALSIVLGEHNRGDGERLESKRIEVIPNCIDDPCPDFDAAVLPGRRARASIRNDLLSNRIAKGEQLNLAGENPEVFKVIFVSLCHRPKGLFDALDAIGLANAQLRESRLRCQLTVAGAFWFEHEKREFIERVARPDLQNGDAPMVEYRGFVSGAEKHRLFLDADCLCFPTYYPAESFPVVLVEGMAYGLPIVATRWRMLPELMPDGYSGLVDPRSPNRLADALLAVAGADYSCELRTRFLNRYTSVHYQERVLSVLRGLEG